MPDAGSYSDSFSAWSAATALISPPALLYSSNDLFQHIVRDSERVVSGCFSPHCFVYVFSSRPARRSSLSWESLSSMCAYATRRWLILSSIMRSSSCDGALLFASRFTGRHLVTSVRPCPLFFFYRV